MPLRHERRRRIVADEELAQGDESSDSRLRLAGDRADKSDSSTGGYAAAVRRDCQRRVVDLVPHRGLAIVWCLLAALLLVGLVGGLHYLARSVAIVAGSREAQAFDLDRPNNVSHWLSSMLLAVGGLLAMNIYALRRHRVDDYHGRYRVWLWASLGCMLASFAESSDLVVLFREGCRRISELCSLRDAVVWPASVSATLGLIAMRLFFEVRRCRLAVVAMIASASCFSIAAIAAHELFFDFTLVDGPLVERGSWLTGYVFGLGTFLLYARHVSFEIEGKVAVVPAKRHRTKARPTQERSNAESPKPALHVRTDLEPVAQTKSSSPPASVRMSDHPAKSIAAADAGVRGMSRAERRRMRRETRMAG